MTWSDLVYEVAWSYDVHGPFAADEIEYLLWEHTPFPVGGLRDVRVALNQAFYVWPHLDRLCELCGIPLLPDWSGICERCTSRLAPVESEVL